MQTLKAHTQMNHSLKFTFFWLIYNYTTFVFKLRVVIWFQGPFSLDKHEAGVTKIPLPSELSGGMDHRYIKSP